MGQFVYFLNRYDTRCLLFVTRAANNHKDSQVDAVMINRRVLLTTSEPGQMSVLAFTLLCTNTINRISVERVDCCLVSGSGFENTLNFENYKLAMFENLMMELTKQYGLIFKNIVRSRLLQ